MVGFRGLEGSLTTQALSTCQLLRKNSKGFWRTHYWLLSSFYVSEQKSNFSKEKALVFASGHPKGHLLLLFTKTCDSKSMSSWSMVAAMEAENMSRRWVQGKRWNCAGKPMKLCRKTSDAFATQVLAEFETFHVHQKSLIESTQCLNEYGKFRVWNSPRYVSPSHLWVKWQHPGVGKVDPKPSHQNRNCSTLLSCECHKLLRIHLEDREISRVWITRSLITWFRHRFPLNEALETALQNQAFSAPSQVCDYMAENRNYDIKWGERTEASATVSICASTGNSSMPSSFTSLTKYSTQSLQS